MEKDSSVYKYYIGSDYTKSNQNRLIPNNLNTGKSYPNKFRSGTKDLNVDSDSRNNRLFDKKKSKIILLT